MRAVFVGVAVMALGLGGCASSSGDAAGGFMSPAIEAAFIPLSGVSHVIVTAHGAATVLAPGIAVTNAHNANIVDETAVLGRSQQYDLLFFKTDRTATLPVAAPQAGEQVVAYGEGDEGELRVSYGTILRPKVPVKPACPVCAVQEAFTYESNAGPGFSGGPVLDREGHLLGITFGYLDDADGKRVMYAYDMARVNAEYAGLSRTVADVSK
jgi:hypothetical protein